MNARAMMTSHPAVVTIDADISAAATIMRIRDIGMLPVVDSEVSHRLVGVITDRDIVVRAVAPGHGPTAKVREHMSRAPLVTVSPAATLAQIAEKMRRHQVRRLPVVDDQDVVIGIIAQADLAVAVGPSDPLLVERILEGISRPGALVRQS